MKNLLIAVLAVFTAASTLSAQDTLKVRSYRVVDLCQNERRWLLAVDLGKILPSDSLVSFDITIGYDRTKLRPTDVLKEGTLSAAMSYEPFLNTAVTNEMRIAAGNIVKTVYGDVPLVAIAGDFLGNCVDFDTLGYPWPATFNSEFKKKITVVRFDTVKALANPKVHPDRGFSFPDTALTISETESSTTLETVCVGVLDPESKLCIVVSEPQGLVNMTVQSVTGMKVDSIVGSDSLVKVYVSNPLPSATINLSTTWTGTKDQPHRALVKVHTQTIGQCICNVAAFKDSVEIVKEYPSVSVSSSDERGEIFRVLPETVVIHCDHEKMKNVQVFDVLGTLVYQESSRLNDLHLSTSKLSKGAYHIRVTCGQHQHATTILK